MPETGLDVLLYPILSRRSYRRTSRTGSKSSMPIYIYMCNSLIRFNKGTPKNKRNSSDSWGGCVVKLSRFPAICRSRKPTTSSEDGRCWVSPPFTEFTRQMTSLDIAPSKNGRCMLIDRINTTNKLRTSLFHTHFNLFHRQSTIFVETWFHMFTWCTLVSGSCAPCPRQLLRDLFHLS